MDWRGDYYHSGLSYLDLCKLSASAGARSRANRYLSDALAIFESLDAGPELRDTRGAIASTPAAGTGAFLGAPVDGEAALVRRIVDAAVTPALLAKEGTTTLLEACDGQAAVIFTQPRPTEVQVIAAAGCETDSARALAGAALARAAAQPSRCWLSRESGTRGARRALRPSLGCGRSRRRCCSASGRCAPCCARDSICARRANVRSSPRPAPSSARSSRSFRDSSARAPRCSA